MAKPAVKAKLTEAYNTMAAGYVNFDGKEKQKYANFVIDPTMRTLHNH
jgi:hypothetical protein